MKQIKNQQAFKDALRSTDPDEVDMEHKECEWKMTWDDDAWDRAREFELFDPEYPVEELEAQKEADVNQRLPAPVHRYGNTLDSHFPKIFFMSDKWHGKNHFMLFLQCFHQFFAKLPEHIRMIGYN